MATHSSILAWKSHGQRSLVSYRPWGCKRVGHDLETKQSEQCKETEENNRIGKTKDLFKKVRDTKGTFHVKMGSIKDRNGMALREAEILRRGGKNTQKNYAKKIFMTQIITMV